MNYEKRYKDALERAKDMLAYKEVRQEDIEYLFPELQESITISKVEYERLKEIEKRMDILIQFFEIQKGTLLYGLDLLNQKNMNYEEKYKQALNKAKKLYGQGTITECLGYVFPELKESEDERTRKELIEFLKLPHSRFVGNREHEKWIDWLEKQKEPEDRGEISDGYHTFNELYQYRMLYNAAFFNLLPKQLVHKSKRHHDGKECFGGGWFIVMANLPTGQISNHYELKDWDLFQIPEKEIADEWDGHTPQEAAERLHKYLLEKQGKKLDPDEVIEWMRQHLCTACWDEPNEAISLRIGQFKKDFGL